MSNRLDVRRHPEIGEEVVLGDRGIFRVTGVRPEPLLPDDVTAYNCERVRDATHENIAAMRKGGVDRLPPPP